MTAERWTDDHLDELAATAAANRDAIALLRQVIAAQNTAITGLRQTAGEQTIQIASLLAVAQANQDDMTQLSTQTRGLQREIRHLVEELRQGRDGEQPEE